ncbi:MAG: SGNH/GDSL hydrolase family protein [Bacteroidales bacterium]|nr:SGNH/GDSL hydrolase family protein [Bacteroidales bacterium]
MKRKILTLFFAAAAVMASAQNPKDVKLKFIEASDLNLAGKIFYDTPNPYHRVDTVRFKGFTDVENLQVRESSGIACTFRTDSRIITVKTVYGTPGWPQNGNAFSGRGYDLYIRKDGRWVYAESGVAPDNDLEQNYILIKDMDPVEHECLLYLPLYSEVNSVKIGVEEGSRIEAFMPFRHRIAIFGSSYTLGSSTSRSGMTYPALFSRATGIQLLSLGCSGNCKLQDYFCDVLCAAEDVDAFVFDASSNPSPSTMEERLFPFIEKLKAAQPGKPLTFQRTIRRESRNFSNANEEYEARKMRMADSLMAIAVKKYDDVYYISPDASSPDHNATVDGTHPDNYGYSLWEKSIEKPLLKILRKYGIR